MHLSGGPLDFLIAFFGGLLSCLTPCIYPLIPVSAGYLVGNAPKSRAKGFLLGLTYVTGISVTYSFLGILAVLSGSIFGKFSSHPIVGLVVGLVIIAFGLSMFGVFQFKFFSFQGVPALKQGNFLSTFFFGLVSGLMVSPCLTPVLGSILAYVSLTKNLFYGGFLLFCFAYGMGSIFILISTFGSKLSALPKPGKWLELFRKIFASLIIFSGAYFVFQAIRRF